MKKTGRKLGIAAVLLLLGVWQAALPVQAKPQDTIESGIYIGNTDVSGMTAEEAK